MKWIEYLLNFAKSVTNGTLVVDSYGKCFHNVNQPVSRHQNNWYASKIEVLKNYKFSVAFENSKSDSYVTEKIFMALEAGTIPLYYGTEKVKFMVPTRSFVHTDSFSSNKKGMEDFSRHILRLKSDFDAFSDTSPAFLAFLASRTAAKTSSLGGSEGGGAKYGILPRCQSNKMDFATEFKSGSPPFNSLP